MGTYVTHNHSFFRSTAFSKEAAQVTHARPKRSLDRALDLASVFFDLSSVFLDGLNRFPALREWVRRSRQARACWTPRPLSSALLMRRMPCRRKISTIPKRRSL